MADVGPMVIGIGASAGGLDAFRSFFENMPADNGMAFIVVLHLPQHRKSMLPEILARWTVMPVCEAVDGMRIEADHVYVVSPDCLTTMAEGTLQVRLRDPDGPRYDHPIDIFFDSLALDERERAVGIVLSGTGSDGALGLKAIKGVGGLTVAQATDGAAPQHDGMPASAIATGMVDLVIPVGAMPEALARLCRPPRADGCTDTDLDHPSQQTEALRLQICDILRGQLGHDFSGYKQKTFLRRVQRRMQVLNIGSMTEYVQALQGHGEEVVLLFKDLLIRVTSFFRDAETFDLLARLVMPILFENKQADDTVRVWVPGCATGEEAYSLAMLLRECTDGRRGAPKIQVFATDIDEPAIATARTGRYPTALLEGMSAERRARFFNQGHNSAVVTKEIRDICTFSTHSLVRDPPFSRMDMISCRNLLIYLDAKLQSDIIPAFHYSLVKDGILLLGSSESVARHHDLFASLDKAARIFQRREVPTPPLQLARTRRPVPRPGRETTSRTPRPRSSQAQGGSDALSADPDHSETGHGDAAMTGWVDRANGGLRTGLRRARALISGTADELEQLRLELRETQDQLQAITEEHETALEELRSANEELHSVNEELQSTNEELETSKEEIQSVNEELHTVNAQLSEKVDELDRNATDLKNLFDSTEVATIFLDRHLLIRGYTPAVGSIYNLIPSDQGRPITDIVNHLRYDALRDDVQTVLETLQPLERRVSRSDRDIHYIMRVLPYRAPDSSVDGTLVTFVDVTTVVQGETHQRLLVDELNHRVKNMLTVVISLASQTLRRSDTLDSFSEAFMGRIKALSASYSLLSRANWNDIALSDVLMEEIRPFLSGHRDNIIFEGPAVRLAPQGALAVGMAIHELVTNAVKHGALSAPSGTVRISWRLEMDPVPPIFTLDWLERGGPAVLPPPSRGFGTTLIERGFAHELSGSAHIDFAPEGVHVRLRAPVGSAVLAPDAPVRAEIAGCSA